MKAGIKEILKQVLQYSSAKFIISISLSIYLSIYLSACLPVCLSVYLSFSVSTHTDYNTWNANPCNDDDACAI